MHLLLYVSVQHLHMYTISKKKKNYYMYYVYLTIKEYLEFQSICIYITVLWRVELKPGSSCCLLADHRCHFF